MWDPTSTAAYLVKNDVYTWQAWNPYGGYDFYTGLGACPRDVYPSAPGPAWRRSTGPTGTDRAPPTSSATSTRLVRFAEQHGLDVTYATDVTSRRTRPILLDHTTLSRSAMTSAGRSANAKRPRPPSARVNIVFFAASPVLRHVRPQASPLGPDRELVDYRDSIGGPPRRPRQPARGHRQHVELAPGQLVGDPVRRRGSTPAISSRRRRPSPFVVADASAWIFAGTGLHNGARRAPACSSSDFDQFDPGTHPADLEILAHSPIPAPQAESSSRHALAFSDMTYYTDPTSDAGVFDSGTNSWIPSLGPCLPTVTH